VDVPVAEELHNGLARCFKCPKERRQGDPGWHFVDLRDNRKLRGPSRFYVCPEDYLDFAAGERARWTPVLDPACQQREQSGVQNGNPAPVEPPACTADELISVLAVRGLAGWAFLIRDVAAGRVRRVHLRQLPADPEIRRALVAYLQSAGATVTVSRSFLSNERRLQRSS
jgi:hypothetical protein